MRKGTTPMGAIETMMIDAAYAQIGKFLKLPTHAYMGLERRQGQRRPGRATRRRSAPSSGPWPGSTSSRGPGMLDFESCQSLEKLVIDDGICAMVYRLLAGVAQRDEPIALDTFEGFTAGMSFLSHPHTRKWYRKEHIGGGLADRDPFDAWVAAGRTSIVDKAHADVARRLERYAAPPLDGAVLKELDRIMAAYARSSGLGSLPLPSGL